MDREWARRKLGEFASVADTVADVGELSPVEAGRLRMLEPTARKILERLDPSLCDFDTDREVWRARNAAHRGLGILNSMDEWTEKLGSTAPTLPADRLHPWVWEAAQSFWDSKHYRAAVDAAARSVTAHTQTKVSRRDIFDTDLMNQVFAEKQKSGQTYLRIPGDPADRTVLNRNRALRPFAEGCYAGIRALAAHETGPDWSEQRALESLAAFSILAGWIEECEAYTPEADDT